MRLLLVRHGRTANNVNHIAQGHLNADLDEVGIRQAQEVAAFLASYEIATIFSSDLNRCIQTATPLAEAKSLVIESTHLLRERFLGELEGAPIAELIRAFDEEVERTGENCFLVKPLGAENAYEVMDRATNFLSQIRHRGDTVAVFTHGMMKEVLLCNLIGAPVETSRSFRFDNAAVTELVLVQSVWVIKRFNETPPRITDP
jgi:2,3-bisphosphoglycerate-dependent phosphoglycerate mutase